MANARTSGSFTCHISNRAGGHALCGSKFACMSTTMEEIKRIGYDTCKRCQNKWNKQQEVAEKVRTRKEAKAS